MTEVVEQDTHDKEDISDVKEFLLHDIIDHSSFLQFSFGYNKRVFDGWVKQPSACCGAASIAGAWNALCCYHRNDPGALSHVDILRVFHSMFIDIVDRYTRAFERRLGASLGSLMEQVEEELKKKGREIGGRKGFHASKVTVVSALKRLARTRLGSRPLVAQNDQEGGACVTKEEEETAPALPDVAAYVARDALDCVIELFEGSTDTHVFVRFLSVRCYILSFLPFSPNLFLPSLFSVLFSITLCQSMTYLLTHNLFC